MRINQMVVISGPAGIGKSTIILKMMNGELGPMLGRLGINNIRYFVVVDPSGKLLWPGRDKINRMILHYDFIKRMPFQHDPIFRTIMECPSITWITLWATPGTLVERIEDRARRISESLSGFTKLIFNLRKIGQLTRTNRRRLIYLDSVQLANWYRRWFQATSITPKDHWILDVDDLNNPILMSRDQWLARDGNRITI